MYTTEIIRQNILEQALRGELVPQTEHEDDAINLLEQIKKEKQDMVERKIIKKSVPLPPIEEKEIPYELPKGWIWVRLGDVSEIKGGKRIPKGYKFSDQATNHVYIRVTDMKSGTISMGDLKYIDDGVYQKIKNYTISTNDLYVTIAGTIGRVGTIPQELDGMNLTENACKVTPVLVDLKYMKYLLTSELVQKQFQEGFNQLAQPKLSLRTLNSVVIALPPLSEQKQIANKIDELFSVCDQWESEVEFQKKHLEILREKVLEDAMKGILVEQDSNDEPASVLLKKLREENQQLVKEGKIKKADLLPAIEEDEIPYGLPSGWEWARLGELGSSNIGLTYKPSNLVEEGTPVLRANNIKDSKMNYLDLVYVDIDVDEKLLAKSGDLLICSRSGSKNLVGKCAIVDKEGMSFGAFMAIFRSEMNGYIHKFLISKLLREQLFQSQTTTIFQITQKMLKNFVIPVPPINEQKRIVEKIESIFETLDEIEKNIISPK